MTKRALTTQEQAVLGALKDARSDEWGFNYLSFAAIEADTALDRKTVRRACRYLARRGMAEYERGLWTESGEMAGSGYCYKD